MNIPSITEDHPLNGTGYSNSGDGSQLPRHRWYWVKESFSPKIVEAAISSTSSSRSDLILDPFCGSGTVPLTAISNERRALGYEVNPFLAFVSRTKLLSARPTDVKAS